MKMENTKEKEFPKHRILSAGKFTETYVEGCRNGQRFCFILGSGASVESGIPMGGTLEYRWMNCLMGEESDRGTEPMDQSETKNTAESFGGELQHDFDTIVREWKAAKKRGKTTLPSKYYFDIYKLRFYPDETNGDRYLENLMESAQPSFGYHTLAQLLTDGNNNNMIITTNFDTLVEDALFLYTGKKPLIINHEFEADFIRDPSIKRPIIAKLHRGLFFKPLNNPDDTTGLRGEWAEILREIFKIYTPVVIGYGGGDQSLMKFLLTEGENIPKMYWCYVNECGLPDERIQQFIKNKRNGYFVRTDGFDHIMLTMGMKMFFPKISTNATEVYLKRRTDERIERYNDQYQKLQEMSEKGAKKELVNEVSKFTEKEKEERKEREKTSRLTAWDYVRDGHAYHNKKEYEKALLNYNKAIELNPEYEYAYVWRGKVYYDQKEYEKALTDYSKAIELNPEYEYSYTCRGEVYYDEKEYEKALTEYSKAIELNPEDEYAYARRGDVYYDEKEYEKALIDYSKVIELNPEDDYAYACRGDVYYEKKEYEKALADFDRAIELDSKEIIYYLNRVDVYRKLGMSDKAEADEQKIKELEREESYNSDDRKDN